MQKPDTPILKESHKAYFFTWDVPPLLHLWNKHDNRSLATGGNHQKEHSEPAAQTTKNTTMCTSIQHKIIYKPGLQLFIYDWLSRHNHKLNKDEEILWKRISTIVIEMCTHILKAMTANGNITVNSRRWTHRCVNKICFICLAIHKSRSSKSNVAMLVFQRQNSSCCQNSNERKKKNNAYVIAKKSLDQLHAHHIGIEKTRLLECGSIQWFNWNFNIEYTIKNCHIFLHVQPTQPKDKALSHEKLVRPWKSVGADIFSINNNYYLCIVHYSSKFPVIEQV